uniref:Centrosomal AT-AC splicing factor n=1 Tax=Sphenodon punctatus TaxID=8508 RepID=A0A8D0GIW4_SPHPU
MVRSAVVVKYEEGVHRELFWCLCCRQEVKRHLSHGSLTVLHGGLLQHFASPEHKKEVSRFWWENKAEGRLKPQFVISPEDYERFKVSLVKALDAYEEREDELVKEMAACIREVEQSRQELLQATLELPAEGEQCDGASAFSAPVRSESNRAVAVAEEQSGPSGGLPMVPDHGWLEGGPALTFIGHQEAAGKGNIHTGAEPPWLMQDEAAPGSKQIGPSYEEFLKEREKQNLQKLPPERVGANFDHASQTGDGWLPSFGRVWNHGRRWQSRHQYKSESGEKAASQKKKERPKPNNL